MLPTLIHLSAIAVAIAISSVPIMATILILLSPGRDRSAVPFLVGWGLGLLGLLMLSTAAAQAIPSAPRRRDEAAGIAELVIGALLVVGAVITAVRASHERDAAMPRWLRSVQSIGGWKAFTLALVLNLRPKSLLLLIAAGIDLRVAGLDAAQGLIVVVVFIALAGSTVAVPIILTLASPQRMEPKLRLARDWLMRHSHALTAVIMLLVGALLMLTGAGRL